MTKLKYQYTLTVFHLDTPLGDKWKQCPLKFLGFSNFNILLSN